MYSIIRKESVVVQTEENKEAGGGPLVWGRELLRNGVSVKTKHQDQSGSSLDEVFRKSTTAIALTMMRQLRLSQNEEL